MPNKKARNVPKRRPTAERPAVAAAREGASRDAASRRAAPQDARARRTQRALSVAMVELMVSHGYEAMSVQDVLDRSGVGRSTFYAHFRNKDDLLLSDTERLIGLLDAHFTRTVAGTRRLAPFAELAAHLGDYAPFVAALVRSGKAQDVWDLLVGEFARIIARRLDELEVPHATEALPREVSARLCAGAGFTLLQWWMDHERPISVQELDARFHTMVWRGVAVG